MEKTSLQNQLFAMQDRSYQEFQSGLIPDLPKEKIIGIRMPALRSFAKIFGKMEEANVFLEELPHTYYEENNLHMLLIGQRKDFSEGVFSEGSVGKIMPFVYVRGYLSHIGKVFEGLNPLNIMSEIVRRTELNMDFSDVVGNESAPPPTWLYLRDSKKQYDVSLPLSASGCFSILTLDQTPADVMAEVRRICEDSFSCVIDEMNERIRRRTNDVC